jgi:flagellar hook-associated protein 1 FlgK
MSLSAALDGAIAGLSVASAQISVVSRNIASQSGANASRKIANVVTVNGLPAFTTVSRASDDALLKNLLSANGDQAQQSAISDSLTELEATLGAATNDTTSPTALMGQLTSALQSYEAAPQNIAGAQAAVTAAQNLAKGLNSAAATVQGVREQADAGIASAVSTINSLLSRFHEINDSIVNSPQGADITDLQDQRDTLLQKLSSEIGITTVTRGNNDMAIFTDSGVTLFDKTPRSVTFPSTANFSAATQGQAVYADGVPITAQGSPLSIHTGRLAGLVSVRDNLGVTYQKQLDEIARGLITNFQETDQSAAPAQPAQAGLFTDGASLTVPPAGVVIPGLASTMQVAAAVDAATGNPELLRDGGISSNGAAPYVYNPTPGQAGYTDRLTQLITNMQLTLAFDASAGAGAQTSVTNYAASSASWLGAQVSQASTAASYSAAVQNTSSTALSNATGVSGIGSLRHKRSASGSLAGLGSVLRRAGLRRNPRSKNRDGKHPWISCERKFAVVAGVLALPGLCHNDQFRVRDPQQAGSPNSGILYFGAVHCRWRLDAPVFSV